MALADGAQAMLAASAALYGFVVAYYIFARLLQGQERWQEEYRWRTWESVSTEHYRVTIRKLAARAAMLNLFLIGASVGFLVVSIGVIAYLFDEDVGHLTGAFFAFVVFMSLTFTWFLWVGVLNLGERLSEWNRARGPRQGEGE